MRLWLTRSSLQTTLVKFVLVPTLEKLRDLYRIPLGPERFQAYIDTVVGDAKRSSDLHVAPLVQANPMAKTYALDCVQRWIELGIEDFARELLEEIRNPFESSDPDRTVKVGFTVLDDLKGGWTQRTFNDAARFETGLYLERTGWASLRLWTSESPALEGVRPLVLEVMYRAEFVVQHGDPQTLREMMRQEGLAGAFAGRTLEYDWDELEYSRAVLAPHLESTQQPTTFAGMYGDEAARELGYPPLGLSAQAGFQVGLANALEAGK